MIRELYSLDNGFFDPLFGSIELPQPTGKGWSGGSADQEGSEPQVFVISACGTGIPVYRKLQKKNIPFIAGILTPGDKDYQLARLLAARVITSPDFEALAEPAFAEAAEAVHRCSRVIATDFPIGTMNRRIEELIELADREGKLERV